MAASSSPGSTNGILSNVKHHLLACLLLLWITYLHLSGLYLFTKGFLLTRLTLEETNTCSPTTSPSCSLPPKFDKAVVLIIDALRFDFISPSPPMPEDPNHHRILSLPAELTASDPAHSLIFHAHSDPPTTTLQRLKGLTTGSLPTFIEAGSNFAGSAVQEDSWILQLGRAGKKIGFMGDDTWMSIFPNSFDKNLTYPFDSFNVEDLHSVDEGVISHLLPLLKKKEGEEVVGSEDQNDWDVLIGHFLGVDHVGHRLGPSHPTMRAKLSQMNDVLRKVVAELDDSTLLVLLGDHGMDRKGDHGGDGELETSSAMWFYSKGPSFSTSNPLADVPTYTLSGAPSPARFVQQIDLVPSLSLLLGLPIPYNNLGSVIPELFSSEHELAQAMKANAQQVRNYLRSYENAGSVGREMKNGLSTLEKVWEQVEQLQVQLGVVEHEESLVVPAQGEKRGTQHGVGSRLKSLFGSHSAFTHPHPASQDAQQHATLLPPSLDLMNARRSFMLQALAQCRLLWAQFNAISLLLGLCILLLSLPTIWTVYFSVSQERSRWEGWVQRHLGYALWGALAGGLIGALSAGTSAALGVGGTQGSMAFGEIVLYTSALASELAVLIPQFLPAIQVGFFFIYRITGPIQSI